MEFIGRRKIFLVIALLLATSLLSAAEEENWYMEDPLAPVSDTTWGNRSRELRHAIDTQNCGKGSRRR